jgi:hypothetical protein
MSVEHGLMANRFELKYVIDEPRARAVRDYVRAYLEPDPYADPKNEYSYYIHSLYVDGPGLALCYATVHGHKNRFKLRIRFYDDKPTSPCFFEIKRRVKDVILKERAAVKKSSVERLLHGYWPERSDLLNPNDDEGYHTLWKFLDMRECIRGNGRIFVSYLREAWVSPDDDSVRVTVDRYLATEKYRGHLGLDGFEKWRRPPLEGVVLELKFTDRYPNWMGSMVQDLDLWRGQMAKYVNCHLNREPEISTLWEDHLKPDLRDLGIAGAPGLVALPVEAACPDPLPQSGVETIVAAPLEEEAAGIPSPAIPESRERITTEVPESEGLYPTDPCSEPTSPALQP